MAPPTSPKKSSLSKQTSTAGRPPQAVKFARRSSSGRVVSLSREEDLDMSGDYSGQNDYINYTVLMPPTPDNQPSGQDSDSKPDGPSQYQTSRFGPSDARRGQGEGGSGGSGGNSGAKMERRMSVMKSNNKSMLLRSQTGDFDHNRWLFETKGKYGIGNAFWSPSEEDGYGPDVSMSDFMDKPWKPLTRKIKVPAQILSPYRYACYVLYPCRFFFFFFFRNMKSK